jgi:molecular chaperone Hsp33
MRPERVKGDSSLSDLKKALEEIPGLSVFFRLFCYVRDVRNFHMTSTQSLDRWLKCISANGNLRGVAIQATQLIQSMAAMHKIEGSAAQALGEAVMGAMLIGSYCKNQERVNLNVQGSGDIKQALVDAYPDGSVRGYVVQRGEDEISIEFEGQGPWGSGFLSVLRTKNAEHQQPYIGTVPLLTGHLAKDLTYYWAQSEQVPSAVGLAVCQENGQITAAGGFLVQAMPGATAEEIKSIERHIQEIESLAGRVAQDPNPLSLLSQIFQDTAFILVEEKPLTFKCNCSWERVNRALTLIGSAELKEMLMKEKSASVKCDFCSTEYLVDADGLKKLIEMVEKGS